MVLNDFDVTNREEILFIPIPNPGANIQKQHYDTKYDRRPGYRAMLGSHPHLFTPSFFPRVTHPIILAHPDLRPLLRHDMLDKYLACVRRPELADPPRIPELAGNPEILTAAHQRIGPAPLRRGGDAIRREIVLFAARH